jgi:hypothetical protein
MRERTAGHIYFIFQPAMPPCMRAGIPFIKIQPHITPGVSNPNHSRIMRKSGLEPMSPMRKNTKISAGIAPTMKPGITATIQTNTPNQICFLIRIPPTQTAHTTARGSFSIKRSTNRRRFSESLSRGHNRTCYPLLALSNHDDFDASEAR